MFKVLSLALLLSHSPVKSELVTLARVSVVNKSGEHSVPIPSDFRIGTIDCHAMLLSSGRASGAAVTCNDISGVALCDPDRQDSEENALVILDKSHEPTFIHVQCVTISVKDI